eukprot:364775-Chlamydomonas_euryale.AAC.14
MGAGGACTRRYGGMTTIPVYLGLRGYGRNLVITGVYNGDPVYTSSGVYNGDPRAIGHGGARPSLPSPHLLHGRVHVVSDIDPVVVGSGGQVRRLAHCEVFEPGDEVSVHRGAQVHDVVTRRVAEARVRVPGQALVQALDVALLQT